MEMIVLNLADNKDTEVFIIVDKIASFRRRNPNESKIVLTKGIWYDVKQTPEEIRQKIIEATTEFEIVEGVELKTEIELTEFDRLEDFVNDVGIVHEVIQAGQDWQIVRLEKNDVSMNFRFYKNKFKDWHVINKGSLLIDKNRNER